MFRYLTKPAFMKEIGTRCKMCIELALRKTKWGQNVDNIIKSLELSVRPSSLLYAIAMTSTQFLMCIHQTTLASLVWRLSDC